MNTKVAIGVGAGEAPGCLVKGGHLREGQLVLTIQEEQETNEGEAEDVVVVCTCVPGRRGWC